MSISQYTARAAEKEATRQRIVAAAAKAIRRSGYDSPSVAKIMKEVGLTHGAFYAYFPSRKALLAAAADHAGAEAVMQSAQVAASVPQEQALNALIAAYLSAEHVQAAEISCPVATLGTELPRQAPEVRAAATRRIKEMVDLVARQSPDWGTPQAHQQALAMVCTMVGGLLLARAVDDKDLSERIRTAALHHLEQKE